MICMKIRQYVSTQFEKVSGAVKGLDRRRAGILVAAMLVAVPGAGLAQYIQYPYSVPYPVYNNVYTVPAQPATAIAPVGCLALSANLSVGSRDYYGAEVSRLQDFLRSQGYYTYATNGYFGPELRGAVSVFQAANGLPAVGSVGPRTRELIRTITCGTGTAYPYTVPYQYNTPYNYQYPYNYPYYNQPYQPSIPSQVTIASVDGSTRITRGESRAWTVNLTGGSNYYYNNNSVTVSVQWGDEGQYYGYGSGYGYQSNSTQSLSAVNGQVAFTHTYWYPGIYNATFTVTDQWGRVATYKTAITVQ